MINCCFAEYGQGKLFEKSFPWNPSKTFNKKNLPRDQTKGADWKALDPSRAIRIAARAPFTAHVGPLPHNYIPNIPSRYVARMGCTSPVLAAGTAG